MGCTATDTARVLDRICPNRTTGLKFCAYWNVDHNITWCGRLRGSAFNQMAIFIVLHTGMIDINYTGYGTLVFPSIRWYISISTVSFKMLGHFHSSLFTDMDLAAILTLAPQKIELVTTSPTMFNLFLTNNQLPKNDAYLMYIFFLLILFLLIHIAYQQFIDRK